MKPQPEKEGEVKELRDPIEVLRQCDAFLRNWQPDDHSPMAYQFSKMTKEVRDCIERNTRPRPDAEKLVDELLEMRAQAAIFQRYQDYTTVKTLKSKLLALLAPAPVTPEAVCFSHANNPSEWPTSTFIPTSVSEWTDEDYEQAMALVKPIFDQIGEYESIHFPMEDPSPEVAAEFRRDQMGEVPPEKMEAGKRYVMHVPVELYECDNRLWPDISYCIGHWGVQTLIEEGITFTEAE